MDTRQLPRASRFVRGFIAALWVGVVPILSAADGLALIRHAPSVNGTLEGSVQVMTAESFAINGGGRITGDLLVPGSPTIRVNGQPQWGGITTGSGSATPAGWRITLNGGLYLGRIVTQSDPLPLPIIPAPPSPTGTRHVNLNHSGQTAGDFTSLRNLTLNGGAGTRTIPAGHYGRFTANGGSGFALGIAGTSEPTRYSFENLTLNGGSSLQINGPVEIVVANAVSLNAPAGNPAHPEWLMLHIADGGLTLNGGATFHGYVVAPGGRVTINTLLNGGLACDRLTINGGGRLRLLNQPPIVSLTAPTLGSRFAAPADILVSAEAHDADGSIERVEFFHQQTKIGESSAAPYAIVWTSLPAGSYSVYARAIDDRGATRNSAPATFEVIANVAPLVDLVRPTDGTTAIYPASILFEATASDPDGAIARVEFFAGSDRVGEAHSPLYVGTWSSPPPGFHEVFARAYDLNGLFTDSSVNHLRIEASLPYVANFEAVEGYRPGSLDGQLGWVTAGHPIVVDADNALGARSLRLPASVPATRATQQFAALPDQNIVFVDFLLQPAAASGPATPTQVHSAGAEVAFIQVDHTGELLAWDDHAPEGGQWVPAGAEIPLSTDGAATTWSRLTFRQDFLARRWDLYADSRMLLANLGLKLAGPGYLDHFSVFGTESSSDTHFDHLYIGPDNPLFPDADRDGVDDGYEATHGMNPAVDDRNGDRDGDGLSNVREYILGTSASSPDSDHDNLPDAWEWLHGFDPLTPNQGAVDTDGDGLTDLDEYLAGTNPRSADSDADGMPDGWEISHGLDPLSASDASLDLDGDGVSNHDEFGSGTSPSDYYNGVPPNLQSIADGENGLTVDGALQVRITDPSGIPLSNAPATFNAIQGGHLLSTTPGGPGFERVEVRSDAAGIARTYVIRGEVAP